MHSLYIQHYTQTAGLLCDFPEWSVRYGVFLKYISVNTYYCRLKYENPLLSFWNLTGL